MQEDGRAWTPVGAVLHTALERQLVMAAYPAACHARPGAARPGAARPGVAAAPGSLPAEVRC